MLLGTTCLILLLGLIALAVAYKRRLTTVTETGLEGINYFEDFFDQVNGTPYSSASSGTGAVGTVLTAPDDRSTFVALTISGSGAGSAKFYLPRVITSNDDTVTTVSTEMFINTLSTGSNQVRLLWGSSANVDFDQSLPTAAWQFVYDKTISDNWVCRAVTDASGLAFTQVLTDVPVVANEYIRLKIQRGGGFAYFFVDEVNVATIADVFASTSLYIGGQQTYVAGSPIITSAFDYNWLVHKFAAPRTSP